MAKRYIIACAVCSLLTEVMRRDALTCSVRCRVYLHRHPDCIDPLRAAASAVNVEPFMLLLAKAARALRPDLEPVIMAGTRSLDDVQGDVRQAFIVRVREILRAEKAAEG